MTDADATPLISVIVPTMNSAADLGSALQSLAAQSFRNFEVIVSDGASKDATCAIAASFSSALPRLRVDSRPDTGVYDAINRGVSLAHGAWFLVLGSDDRLHAPATLAEVATHLRREREAQMVYGDVCMMAHNRYGVPVGGRYVGALSLQRFFETNACQQSIFYRRGLFDALGGFDLRYRLCADWAFNLRAEFKVPGRWIDVVVSDYAATGMSANGSDDIFMADLSELIRAGFADNLEQRANWPLQHRVLRDANRFRRKGQWRQAWVFFRTYLRLMGHRIATLLRPGQGRRGR